MGGAQNALRPAPPPMAAGPAPLNALTGNPAPTTGLPSAGYVPGELHLNTAIAPKVAAGAPRPFAPGEYVRNPDGSWSSEISMTVADPTLNSGKATNIPSLWIVDGKPYRARNEDEAVSLAVKSGLNWPTYPDLQTADKAAADRETKWQGLSPDAATSVPPLWSTGAN